MVESDQREAAIKRIKEKRDFTTHLITYLVVNGFLVGIWAVSGQGYFWPIWPIMGWGIGIVLHAWATFVGERPITEEQIERELRRGGDA